MYGGKTDPWIDLALKPTKQFNETGYEIVCSRTCGMHSVLMKLSLRDFRNTNT